MQSIIEFIEGFSLEPQIYVVSRCVDKKMRCAILWRREQGVWRLCRSDGVDREANDSLGVMNAIRELDVDEREATHQLYTVAMTQIVLAKRMLDEATSVFGSADLDEAVSGHREFVTTLQKVVGELTGRSLSIVPGGRSGTKAERDRTKSFLSVVR